MKTTHKPNTAFWIIAIIAIIWNIMGVGAFIGQSFVTDEAIALLPIDQAELLNNIPSWVVVIFGIAVFAGLLGSILLLMKKKLAVSIFMLSLLAVIIHQGYFFFTVDSIGIYGWVQGLIMPVIVILIAMFLYMYSKIATGKGWLS
ncbi:MAG: hypothetical protein ACI9Y7_002469 [Dokdonia sp.]|jgi:hypothetical protein